MAVVCHIDGANDAKLNSVQNNITALADVLPMYLPRKSLDSITVSKAGGKIEYSEMP